jgi:hypothetical protein
MNTVEHVVEAKPEKDGPHQCCAEFAIVTKCDGDTDAMWCGICDRRWTRPCVAGDLVPAVER